MLDRLRFSWPTALLTLLAISPALRADDDARPKPQNAAEILKENDRSLIRNLQNYVRENPTAEDLDQAYLAIFETAIKNDWYLDTEDTAKQYLVSSPNGAVRPMAQIIATLARAKAGQFAEAWGIYKELIKGLDGIEQEAFASDFADSLASEALAAGDYKIARQVYETLLERFGDSPALRAKVQDDLKRIDMVGQPAPGVTATNLKGETLRLSDLQGRYVLIDFWATWCAPCLAELPNLRSAYETYHPKGFEIVSVSLDETPEAVTDFVQNRKIPWPQIHNATCTQDVVAAFGVNNIPTTFLIDPDGKIVRLELRGKALGKALEELIR